MGTLYRISHDEYFAGLAADTSFVRDKEKVRDTMNQLISRFNISGKRILSVGPGLGYEEYWFFKANCRLVFVDIDEYGSLEPYLKTLKPSGDSGACMEYYIGDARDFYAEYRDSFDVCYFSSFTPDELRRGRIQNSYVGRFSAHPLLRYPLSKIPYFERSFQHTWPRKEYPFMGLVISMAQDLLADGGLFVSQSYISGANVISNPHFVQLARKQLNTIGIQLLEVYYFVLYPTVSLMVGLRASEEASRAFMNTVASNPILTKFHGRAEINSGVGKAFDLTNTA